RNNFTDIEKIVQGGNPVYLTKNGYGTMVVMSIDSYSELINLKERIMDEADQAAASTDVRLTSDQVFGALRRKING
nr:type II toxin-antitoxin system Phd/YefM family antitoxin [Lachnospiraceae bacterium]